MLKMYLKVKGKSVVILVRLNWLFRPAVLINNIKVQV